MIRENIRQVKSLLSLSSKTQAHHCSCSDLMLSLSPLLRYIDKRNQLFIVLMMEIEQMLLLRLLKLIKELKQVIADTSKKGRSG